MTGTDTEDPEVSPADRARRRRVFGRLELVATILIAVATVLTAWSAFQSTKWGGVQANSYAAASAARTESGKAGALANTQVTIDVTIWADWLAALADELRLDPNASRGPDGTYQADPEQLSGVLFDRFRDEFKPAVEAWLAQRPLENPDADATPFVVPEYRLAERERESRLTVRAESRAAEARDANQTGDNYVLTTVLFASVLFFAGISSKFESLRNHSIMIIMAVLILIAGVTILATYPIEI
ncbi:MAG: hypothetical protein R6X23_13535 [Acidimicrobiia bacterium]